MNQKNDFIYPNSKEKEKTCSNCGDNLPVKANQLTVSGEPVCEDCYNYSIDQGLNIIHVHFGNMFNVGV